MTFWLCSIFSATVPFRVSWDRAACNPGCGSARQAMSTSRKAERIADAVARGGVEPAAPLSPAPAASVQRVCADCAEEEERLRRKPALDSAPDADASLSAADMPRGGAPLVWSLRTLMEPFFRRDFNTCGFIPATARQRQPQTKSAPRAFTLGKDIVFGPGEYRPETLSGQSLLAHELTHVVQQSGAGGGSVQRLAKDPVEPRGRAYVREHPARRLHRSKSPRKLHRKRPPVPAAASTGAAGPEQEATGAGLVIEDAATDTPPGSMRKTEFLDALRTSVCGASSEAMAGTGQTSEDCPWIDYWFGYYAGQDAAHVETAIRKFAPEAATVTAAADYIPIVTARVRRSVATFTTTCEMPDLPELPGAPIGGGLLGAIGGLFFKARPGGGRAVNPLDVQSRLGRGEAMPGALRSRMESAFGSDFGAVRLHTDGAATQLTEGLGARAFTVGDHVAFGSGEFHPGTPQGDALIAHELAHVVQQGDGKAASGPSDHAALEQNADRSAIGAVASAWTGVKGALKQIAQNAMPRLKSGLQLQSCGKTYITNRGAEVEALSSGAPPTAPDVSQATADTTLTGYGLQNKVTQLAPPTNDYDCHGYTFLQGDRWINDDQVEAILHDNGYAVTATPAVGDIVVYRTGGAITHSGVIVEVSGTAVTTVQSKWGRLGLYRHAPSDVPPGYGPWQAYHTDRADGHRLHTR